MFTYKKTCITLKKRYNSSCIVLHRVCCESAVSIILGTSCLAWKASILHTMMRRRFSLVQPNQLAKRRQRRMLWRKWYHYGLLFVYINPQVRAFTVLKYIFGSMCYHLPAVWKNDYTVTPENSGQTREIAKVTVVHRWLLFSDHNFKMVGQLVVLLLRFPTQSYAYIVK